MPRSTISHYSVRQEKKNRGQRIKRYTPGSRSRRRRRSEDRQWVVRETPLTCMDEHVPLIKRGKLLGGCITHNCWLPFIHLFSLSTTFSTVQVPETEKGLFIIDHDRPKINSSIHQYVHLMERRGDT